MYLEITVESFEDFCKLIKKKKDCDFIFVEFSDEGHGYNEENIEQLIGFRLGLMIYAVLSKKKILLGHYENVTLPQEYDQEKEEEKIKFVNNYCKELQKRLSEKIKRKYLIIKGDIRPQTTITSVPALDVLERYFDKDSIIDIGKNSK